MNGFERRCFDTEANSSYRSDQRFDMQFCFVLTLSSRLCAFLNKGIFDSRLNSKNSYCNSVYGLFTEQKWQSRHLPAPIFHFLWKYSGIPISRTLNFSNFPITRTKSRSLSSVEHWNFTPDFSNYSIFRSNFRFPWRFEKSEFHCDLSRRRPSKVSERILENSKTDQQKQWV